MTAVPRFRLQRLPVTAVLGVLWLLSGAVNSGCSRHSASSSDADLVAPGDSVPALLTIRFEAQPANGLAHAVWIETDGESDPQQIRLRVRARCATDMLGYAFHLATPDGVSLVSHQFSAALGDASVTVSSKLVERNGRLWIGAARFPVDTAAPRTGADLSGTVTLLELVLAPQREGRFHLSFPVARRELRRIDGTVLPAEWLGGTLVVTR